MNNLVCYSTSDSSDEDGKCPVAVEPASDFFNLGGVNKRDCGGDLSNHNHKNTGKSAERLEQCPKSAHNFWSDETTEEDWTDEVSVWGVASEINISKISNTPLAKKRKAWSVSQYVPKRSRFTNTQFSDAALPKIRNTQGGTSLNIHPLIKPVLCKRSYDSVPKKLLTSFRHSSEAVNRISWCSTNFSHLILSASTDGKVRIFDIFSEKCTSIINSHSMSVKDATWSTCGRLIASCGFDKQVFITDVETGMQTFSSSFEEYLACVKFHPSDANLLVVGSVDVILGWDIRESTKPIRKYKYKDKLGQVLDICFLSDKDFLSSCDFVSRDSSDRCIMVWDFNTASVISNEIFHEKYTCPRLCCHPFKKEFIAQTQGNYIAQFSSQPPYKMNKRKQYNHHKVSNSTISPTTVLFTRLLVLLCRVRISLRNNFEVHFYLQVSGYSVGCDINPNGGIVASGSSDGQVVFYNYWSTNIISKIGSPLLGDIFLDVAWHPVLPTTLAFSTWDGRIDVWQ